jgi:hypothetical protein
VSTSATEASAAEASRPDVPSWLEVVSSPDVAACVSRGSKKEAWKENAASGALAPRSRGLGRSKAPEGN